VETADIYAFLTGFYIIWGLGYMSVLAYQRTIPYLHFNQDNRTMAQLYESYNNLKPLVMEISMLLPKVTLVTVLWLGLIPFLIGICINYTIIVPLRSDTNQTPVFYPYYTYALGLLYLKIWFRLMVLEGVNSQWNARFTKITQDGIRNMDLHYILTNVIFPIINYLLLRLCVPYFILKLVLPHLDFPETTIDYISRHIYINFASLIALFECMYSATSYLVVLHSKIRDDKYLIGEQLQNNDNEAEKIDKPINGD